MRTIWKDFDAVNTDARSRQWCNADSISNHRGSQIHWLQKLKPWKFSKIGILAYFAKICTHENYQPYSTQNAACSANFHLSWLRHLTCGIRYQALPAYCTGRDVKLGRAWVRGYIIATLVGKSLHILCTHLSTVAGYQIVSCKVCYHWSLLLNADSAHMGKKCDHALSLYLDGAGNEDCSMAVLVWCNNTVIIPIEG